MVSLLELQRSFAAALRDPTVDCAVTPAANLAIYRNNSALAFRGALEAGFPVVRARVGDDYFGQLVHHYREALSLTQRRSAFRRRGLRRVPRRPFARWRLRLARRSGAHRVVSRRVADRSRAARGGRRGARALRSCATGRSGFHVAAVPAPARFRVSRLLRVAGQSGDKCARQWINHWARNRG